MALTTGTKAIVGCGYQGIVTGGAGYGAITSAGVRDIIATSAIVIGSIVSGFASGSKRAA